jgi:hypothetical protein
LEFAHSVESAGTPKEQKEDRARAEVPWLAEGALEGQPSSRSAELQTLATEDIENVQINSQPREDKPQIRPFTISEIMTVFVCSSRSTH